MPKFGINNNQLMKCPGTPNCVNSQARDKKHFIQPIIFPGTQQEAKNRLLRILNTWKQAKTIVVEDSYIRTEFKSKLLGFVDDVEFYFPATKTKEIVIHVRSASRVGYSDLGVNRKRIEKIRRLSKAPE